MEKILILADINSVHTRKWIKCLISYGYEIGVYSLSKCDDNWYKSFINITVFDRIVCSNQKRIAFFGKLHYLKAIPYLISILRTFKPDLVHAHYASSYGLLGSFLNFKPFVISAWGSDVYEFPKFSRIHGIILRFNFWRATRILSTSNIMVEEIKKYTKKTVTVIPFGIDLTEFKPFRVISPFESNDIVIGTVKALEVQYGVDYLIRTFKLLKDRNPTIPLKLMIVGGGSLRTKLEDLCKELNIEDLVFFTGKVSPMLVPNFQNMLSVFVALSNSESFGVSALEAAACEKPVVVSNVAGFRETVVENETGYIVPVADISAAAYSIEKIIKDKALSRKMGIAARTRVAHHYDIDHCTSLLSHVYRTLLL